MKIFPKYLFISFAVGFPLYSLLFMLLGEYGHFLIPLSERENPLIMIPILILLGLAIYFVTYVLYKVRFVSKVTKLSVYTAIILLPIILMFIIPFPKLLQQSVERSNYSLPTINK